jgi:hypothetical protein
MNYELYGINVEEVFIKILQERMLKTGPYCYCCSGDFRH